MHRRASVPTATTSGTEPSADRARRFRRRVLEWGASNRRDLPWRRTRDPWAVLVSEVMLQQTQVTRVVPHYERFLAAFPTPAACARAGAAAVVRQWSGLGYNRRALSLHRAAVKVVDEHGGNVPHEERALRCLPGVGGYTARAVRSFAFGENVAAVDTNALRVLSRCVAGAPLGPTTAAHLGDRLIPLGAAWEFNQAMFDLGATVCTGARPHCDACPLRRQCRWRRAGRTEPDPWRTRLGVRSQGPFAGSDRQGRGRLLEALRRGAVAPAALADACGWPGDVARAEHIAEALVDEGFARWCRGSLHLL
jgi:A/G-specific adenine glycosylase